MVRDEVVSAVTGAVLIGNNVLRVMGDAMAGLAHLTLRYIDWLALQLLPDTAETEWLDRHGHIWLTNADASTGRKAAAFAQGTVTMTGTSGIIVPEGTELTAGNMGFETTEDIVLGAGPTECDIRALDPGSAGNLEPGTQLGFTAAIAGVNGSATVLILEDGADEETDPELRMRVLLRIREPPMGGDAADYVQWALAVPGVTRAWAAPNEMGIGTITVRVMFDDLRASNDGFPLQEDLDNVTAYIDQVRPVAIKDRWVEAPIPEAIDFTIRDLVPDGSDIRSAIQANVKDMLYAKAAPAHAVDGVLQPAQTIYAVWVSDAIYNTEGVISFELIMGDHEMPYNGSMAVLGVITYDTSL